MARMCMSSNSQQGMMKNQRVIRFLLLYKVLETFYRIGQTADGRTHAFVHVDGDLRYLMDGVSMDMEESRITSFLQNINAFMREEDTSAISFTDLNEENLNAYASPISFYPPMLNFHFHPVGMPHMERVIVQNLSPDTSIHMLSISGNTLHTHCSFFQEKVIPPGGNTSFDVVLLAREEGPVEDTLFIHTSLGSFKFQVSAVGIRNPYRLRPFVGVRMPLNSSFSPIIYMHNPHSSTLQLTEIYSSGGDLHLELPDGESEASKNLWEIPPYETRPVIKANFIARIEKNHTAFIRIRTNCSIPEYILLPVEVDVSSAAGIYSPTEVLDFGVLRSQDEPKVLSLSLLNSGQKHVHIVNVIATPVNEAVDVKFVPIKVPPDSVFSTQIATITFNPARALHPKQCCGKIVIKSKNNQYKLQIPYQVQLLRGFLEYNKNCTKFYVGLQNNNSVREFNVTNNFNVVIIIYKVSLADEAKLHFSIKMTEPVILKPGQSSFVAFLNFKPSIPDLQLNSHLRLHTNISHFDIPLLCFTGRLKVFLPHAINESFIDFGTLGMGDKRTIVFAVINENPVDVNLKFWGSNASKTYVELVGVDKGNASTLAWRQNFSSMARSLILKPQHYAIFRIGITAPTHEGIFQGQAFVETQYEKINVPFSLRTAKGALKVDEIFFENSFPGKISTQSLYVHSTFSHSMTITGISTVPEDSRFVFDSLKHGTPILHPNSKNMVGKIHFDHRKYCKQKCYSGLPTTTTMGHQWLMGMALPPDVAETDKELFRTLCKRWHSLIDLEEKTTNITLRIDTTEVRGYFLKIHASLQWPRLFSKYRLKFPVTQIGNRTVKDFTLENPSSLPILVQVVPLSLYPNPTQIINALKEKYGDDFSSNNVIKDSDIFSLEDLEENNPNPENHIPAYRKSLEEFFGIQSHKKSIAMLLTPGMRVRIQVGFTPKDNSLKSSLILIRNNLTVMDALIVHGQGGNGQIKFGNISPGSDSILLFELTDRSLKDCDSTKSPKYGAPNFTVRKTFTAKNTGALPIYIKGFDINGKSCTGYGFRVFNCQGFELKPNASRKIDIAYTPDFSSTNVQRILNIRTSQGPQGQNLQYTLIATIPKHLLTLCSEALPRPSWEQYLYFAFLTLSSIMIITVMICAYLDSKKILHSVFFPIVTVGFHSEKMEKENYFNLNALCTNNNDSNSYIKHNSYQSDHRKKKENSPEPIILENGPILNSMKNSSVHGSKRKESLNSREIDDHNSENNRHVRKRNSKLKQMLENYSLEPDLVEIKKSQPRNSWTRFLKPPFSFHSCSNINNKPSVATQTTPDSAEDDALKSLKELDIIGDQNINCFINIENNARCKTKNKNESKYSESKSCVKKLNDVLPEEETSSTTTETSTTESDISEKDHRLPDVCVTSKPPSKVRYSKNKTRERSIDNETRVLSKSLDRIEGEGFQLSSKSRGHKKITVDTKKTFSGDILQPSSLELPYKPKPTEGDEKDESLDRSCSSDSLSSALSSSLKSKDEIFGDLVERTQNFARQQGYYNCLWPDIEEPIPSHETYSAALSRDKTKEKKGLHSCSTNSSRFKRSQNCSSLRNPNKHPSVFPPNIWGSDSFTQLTSPDTQDQLSGSKLKHWMVQSTSVCSSVKTGSNSFKEDNLMYLGCQNNYNNFESSCNKYSEWNNNMQVFQALETQPYWSGYDVTSVKDSLWDSNYNPAVFSWMSENKESEYVSNISPIWSNNSVWRSDDVCWSSPCDSCDSLSVPTESIVLETEKSAKSNKVTAIGDFNPFHTPNPLWVPQSNDIKENYTGSTESSAWSFSLFSDPSHGLSPENSVDQFENDGIETRNPNSSI